MGDEVKMVRLYKCKDCGARLFKRDTLGHLERHGLSGTNGNSLSYFVKGKPDTPERPGAAARAGYKQKAKPVVVN